MGQIACDVPISAAMNYCFSKPMAVGQDGPFDGKTAMS